MDGKPLFRSAHEAMVFAANFRHEIVPRSAMSQMAAPSTGGGGKIPGGLDGAAQAGMILGEASRLSEPLYGLCVFARVAPKSKPCSCKAACCSGKVPNWAWLEAIDTITSMAWALQRGSDTGKRGPVDCQRLRRSLVLKYFGEGIILKDLAEECELADGTVSTHFAFFSRTLKKYEKEGWSALDVRLTELKIIGDIR